MLIGKTFTVLRTAFLVFIVYYAFRATPLIMGLPENVTDPYPICKASNTSLQKAIWMAIGWIAFETVVGWWAWTRARKPVEPGLPTPRTSEPPFAPPPHK
jgi:hypothetical protein